MRAIGAATSIATPNCSMMFRAPPSFVADRLKAFGCDEVATGIGQTGVVGVIRGRGAASPRTIGLRADMDALPIHETTNLPYQSANPGKMHACGHDGHTAMLLGAARYLAQSRNFSGTAVVIFQPAEEGGGGGKAMIEDGLMERFGIQKVFGMHNMAEPAGRRVRDPQGPAARLGRPFTIKSKGAAATPPSPMLGVDPIVAGAQIVSALQTIVARNVDPLDSCVVSVTRFDAGDTRFNVMPQSAQLLGTTRALLQPRRATLAERRVSEIARGRRRRARRERRRSNTNAAIRQPAIIADETDFADRRPRAQIGRRKAGRKPMRRR